MGGFPSRNRARLHQDLSGNFSLVILVVSLLKGWETGIPPVVVRVLIFAYEEQTAVVKLAGKRSDTFSITNGTRQGSVLSPLLFSIYLDDLLRALRKLGLGCHIGGVWYGACGYADDLVLLAPNRDVLQRMLKVCEDYAVEHNLSFSTDPVPAGSKTKCMLFCIQIHCSEDLPWVKVAEHNCLSY